MAATPTPAERRRKADNELLFKGIVCAVIGLVVLLSPSFMASPQMRDIVASSSLVGWFATVLGLALIGLAVRRRVAADRSSKPG